MPTTFVECPVSAQNTGNGECCCGMAAITHMEGMAQIHLAFHLSGFDKMRTSTVEMKWNVDFIYGIYWYNCPRHEGGTLCLAQNIGNLTSSRSCLNQCEMHVAAFAVTSHHLGTKNTIPCCFLANTAHKMKHSWQTCWELVQGWEKSVLQIKWTYLHVWQFLGEKDWLQPCDIFTV